MDIGQGNFADPRIVTAIRWLPTERCAHLGVIRARVVVDTPGLCVCLLANDDEHAQQMAADLAVKVNEARAKA